jgi:hypothetical protein
MTAGEGQQQFTRPTDRLQNIGSYEHCGGKTVLESKTQMAMSLANTQLSASAVSGRTALGSDTRDYKIAADCRRFCSLCSLSSNYH